MSVTFLAYTGAACAAWSAMGGFCMRSAAVRDARGWSALSKRDDALWAGAAAALCAASLVLMLRVNVASFALIFWFILLALSGIGFALLLPFWSRLCKWSLIGTGVTGSVALLMLQLY